MQCILVDRAAIGTYFPCVVSLKIRQISERSSSDINALHVPKPQ